MFFYSKESFSIIHTEFIQLSRAQSWFRKMIVVQLSNDEVVEWIGTRHWKYKIDIQVNNFLVAREVSTLEFVMDNKSKTCDEIIRAKSVGILNRTAAMIRSSLG